jgi:hypothetical protein
MLLKHWISACKKLNLDPCLSPCTSIISKGLKILILLTFDLRTPFCPVRLKDNSPAHFWKLFFS